MAIEIVDFPIRNGDFPVRYVNVYQRVVGEKNITNISLLKEGNMIGIGILLRK